MDVTETVRMPRREFVDLLEAVAERGAERALKKIGLHDEEAPADLRELRSLLDTFRDARKTFWQTVVKTLTGIFLTALLVGAAIKIKS